jgi:16S rRNA (guanine527-N7)-methyltransferase
MMVTNEAEARAWIATLPGVSRETFDALERYVALLTAANATQNLVAASTLGEALWARHIVDSAQLVPLAPPPGAGKGGALWVDLGSGPGLPGLIVAILDPRWTVRLVESRRLRCEFLREAVACLDLGARVEVLECKVEALPRQPHRVISARAFAPLPKLLRVADHLADKNTHYLLPKGKNAVNELSTLPRAWQNMFHVEPSLTDPQAGLLIGKGLD